MAHLSMNSPIGFLTIFEDDGAIVALDWGRVDNAEPTPMLEAARDQLNDYFDATRKDFDLPLAPRGTSFQCALWNLLCRIPFGQVQTYGDLARQLDSGPRAVGGACGRNPIPIIIPCHRVIGQNGSLTGYSGGDGVNSKRALLRLEGYDIE
ncbi:MAG: methylated-DNA--[protein]-cysteine S-methyltransferase [Alphaproteobacteria bacterium]|jgi:methylated-DNA-[protein]-cysteine S-methyltransferase|nr:methylated-DNA--[protein]-cysteine S-methyltransferase [Alphaproteobacteria bacterium]